VPVTMGGKTFLSPLAGMKLRMMGQIAHSAAAAAAAAAAGVCQGCLLTVGGSKSSAKRKLSSVIRSACAWVQCLSSHPQLSQTEACC
jgi:hypothetical protein